MMEADIVGEITRVVVGVRKPKRRVKEKGRLGKVIEIKIPERIMDGFKQSCHDTFQAMRDMIIEICSDSPERDKCLSSFDKTVKLFDKAFPDSFEEDE